uniref:Toll-like receptor n=2 Tax=Scylla TaxID=6760 RepID=M4M800_SCYSE|nr:toll-like receptor [Scylla paramamosain]AGG55849.1 toll-like receptor [Scylla serrata]
MASERQALVALWLWLAVLTLATTLSSACPICSKNFQSSYCLNTSTPEEQTYSLKLSNYKNAQESALTYKCHYLTEQMYLTYHQGCNFSTVQYVLFQRCPLPNVSFSDIFAQLGIHPEKILEINFENIGTRRDLELETWHLDGLVNLQILQLKHNLFTSLPPDVFKATPNLEHFLFSQNAMLTLPETLFAHTPKLKTINLLNNNFESIPDNLFINLSNLTVLRLYGNNLKEISPKLFANTPMVYKLELSFNGITNVTSDVFKYLPKLQHLFMKFNDIEFLPPDIFHNCPELQSLHMHYNKLKSLPSELFSKSKNISDFDFQRNEIMEIPEELFHGQENLTILMMQENALENIPDGAFKDLTNLEKLLLQNNPIKSLPPGSFDHQRKMKTLNLANTSLTDLPDKIFKNCESLEEIDLSNNQLSELKSTVFPHPATILRILKLSQNNLSLTARTSEPQAQKGGEIIVEQFPFSDQVNLTYLILSSNRIRNIPHALRNLKKLKHLDLKNNSIEYLDYYGFLFSSDTTADPSDAPWNPLELPQALPTQVIKIELKDNPLICDCSLYNFALWLQGKISEGDVQLDVVDNAYIKCSMPDDRGVQKFVMTLDLNTLVCNRKVCHPSCTCVTRPHDNMFFMECVQQRLQGIPALKAYLPQGNYSVTLNLKNNSITSLEGLQRPEYSNVVNLTMANNYLKFINESYLPRRLQALDVSGNGLTHFSKSLIAFLNVTNPTLSLSGNPWLCDCQLVDLYTFLRDPLRKMANSHPIMCDNSEPLLSLTEEQLCPTIQQPMVVVTVASTTVFLFLFFVLGTVSAYKYQQNIKVWFYTHQMCLWVIAKEEADKKKYDAFISYSNKDEEYVNNVLVPGLESGEPKYRVCLHYRDWVAGDYIQSQINQSIEDSHRTIVILSSNFIENVWGQIEFKTAHSKALKEKSKNIIVIVLGQVPPESEMDEELKLYLSTRTYLQSDHPRFWENLRYAMPHPQEFLYKKRAKTKKTEGLQMVQANGKAGS